MDRRFLTVLGVSLLFALVVSGLFFQLSRATGGSAKAAGPQESKDLVIATKPLTVGAILKAEDVKLVKTPVSAFPKGGFSKIDDVVDRAVTSNVLLEEPLVEGRLAPKGAGWGLVSMVQVGMRAMAVRVTDVVGVAGFVQPGLRVDVLVTGRPPRGQVPITTTVLQNIKVLSSGPALMPDARGQAISYQSVTLEVTPEQAEILTLATNEGRIQLVLRNSKDDSTAATPGSNAAKLYGLTARQMREIGVEPRVTGEEPEEEQPKPRPRPKPAPAAAPVPFIPKLLPPAPPDEIVMLRGDKRTKEAVAPARAPASGETQPDSSKPETEHEP
ncbi:MAG: Flp pilus assembly protein CpaB [Bryobacteraceae bacterium]|nr:Flp pilus assembly protein CpaB [Bryobacteraceae bacterium]